MMLGAHLFGLPEFSQACLELAASGSDAGGSAMGVVTHLFSQCVVV
jgi:hypothetical protein